MVYILIILTITFLLYCYLLDPSYKEGYRTERTDRTDRPHNFVRKFIHFKFDICGKPMNATNENPNLADKVHQCIIFPCPKKYTGYNTACWKCINEYDIDRYFRLNIHDPNYLKPKKKIYY